MQKQRTLDTKSIFFIYLLNSQNENLVLINIDCLQTYWGGKKKGEELIHNEGPGGFSKSFCRIFTFACGDRNVCDQGVQLVRRVLVLIALPGQPHAHPVRHVPTKQMFLTYDFPLKAYLSAVNR